MSDGRATWVIGAGGLLGSALVRTLGPRTDLWFPATPVPWGDAASLEVLETHVHSFAAFAGARPWQVLWSAGAGVTGSTKVSLDSERRTLTHTLDALARADLSPSGAVFVASSAGGVYAGSTGAPFTEASATAPLAPYGHARLAMEELTAEWSRRTGIPSLVGRIANLYGIGQNLSKGQGLISHICRSMLDGQPLSIFVPLDTVRDYLFTDDCAVLVAEALDRLCAEAVPSASVTKIIASGQGVTVGQLISEARRVSKRKPRVVFGSSASTRFQARDLRLRSEVWPDLDRRSLTPLPVGMHRVLNAARLELQRAESGEVH